MSQAFAFTPALSPSFDRARKLSRVMAVLFTGAFLVMLSVLIAIPIAAALKTTPSGIGLGVGLTNGLSVGFKNLTTWQSLGAVVAVELYFLPIVLMLYQTVRLFFCFSKGQVFADSPIARIRAAGLWLTASFFTSIAAVYLLNSWGLLNSPVLPLHFPGALLGLSLWFNGKLFTGIATTIAAYVMEEARRIAADNAEIV